MLEQLTLDIRNNQKALLFIDISSYGFLEGKLGLTALEILLKEFSGFLIQTCAPNRWLVLAIALLLWSMRAIAVKYFIRFCHKTQSAINEL